MTDVETLREILRAGGTDLPLATIEPAGGGDYCQAFEVDDEWIFLIARTHEAARSLARVGRLMPELAPTLPLATPRVSYAGSVVEAGRMYLGYRPIPGVELIPARFQALPAATQARIAAELAEFLVQVHRFPSAQAEQAGVVFCPYPFAASEDGLEDGPAEALFQRDLERVCSYPEFDQAAREFCRRILSRYLDDPVNLDFTPVLLHGEVSQDHVLYDPEDERLTGIIDFNGVVIGDPDRDLLYLYEEYGMPFMVLFLEHYPAGDRRRLLTKLQFFHNWMTVLRLLWALDHQYSPGIALRLRQLRQCQAEESAPPWRAIVSSSL